MGFHNPVDPGEHIRAKAGAVTVEHPNGHNKCSLGDTHRAARCGAGDVGAVAVAVIKTAAIINRGKTRGDPARERVVS